MTKLQKVLIVDASRVVRASLAKYLRGNFDVCEEGDAESAWQSLVLDSSILAVVSGLDIGSIDGAGLVERLRASKLARLNSLPFYLLVSDSFADSAHQLALRLGVSETLPKASAGLAIKSLLTKLLYPDIVKKSAGIDSTEAISSQSLNQAVEYGSQSEVGLSDFMSRVDRLAGLTDDSSEDDIRHPEIRVNAQGEQCLQDSLSSVNKDKPSGVLVFGLDGYDDFRLRYGPELSDKIVLKFARLLVGKVRDDESILHLVGGRIAIISLTAGREQCASFARRVCKALAEAKISLRGERVEATVSAGVAAFPEDSAATTTDELLRLAVSRHDAAVLAGGNRVVFVTGCGGNSVSQQEFFEQLKELLAGAAPETMMSCKGWLTTVCAACKTSRAAGKSPLCSRDASDEAC